jgi:hypothetical protein
MAFVIRCMHDINGNIVPELLHHPRWLKSFDPDACNGRGIVEWTEDLGQALAFADLIEARDYYRQQSKVKPIRADGRPNRPLTSYTIVLERIDDPPPPKNKEGQNAKNNNTRGKALGRATIARLPMGRRLYGEPN